MLTREDTKTRELIVCPVEETNHRHSRRKVRFFVCPWDLQEKIVEGPALSVVTSASMKPLLLSMSAAAALSLAGCATWDNLGGSEDERRQSEMREKAESERLKTDVQRLQGRVEALEVRAREIDDGRARPDRQKQELEERLSKVEGGLRASESAVNRLRQEIVDDLSKKMADLMNAQAARTAPPVPRNAEGYEHIVKAGETLSQIAAAYKVKVDAIVKANSLKSAHALKVGQKLFIPAPADAR